MTVEWVDGSGGIKPLFPVPGNYLSPSLSPGGNRLAYTSDGDIWLYDLKRASMLRVTSGGGYGNPLWTADGRYIVARATGGIFWIDTEGTGRPEPLIRAINPQLPWPFTPDGKRLAFVEIDPATGADLWTVSVETSASGLRAGKSELYLRTPFQERSPMFSPDGRWIAYMSNESGEYQVYVDRFPEKGSRRQVSVEPSGYPAWARSANSLFFLSVVSNRPLMMASYRVIGAQFTPDQPRTWSTKVSTFSTTRSYDPAPDGNHVVALTAAESARISPDRLIFLLNFFDELKRRAPASLN